MKLTGNVIVHKRAPERKTVVKGAALVLGARRLEADGRVDTARGGPGPRSGVGGDEVVERDAEPLGGRGPARVPGRLADFGHVVGAGGDGGREVGGAGAPVVDQEVLKQRHLGAGVEEHGGPAIAGDQQVQKQD